jgi:hypothetical protein
MRDKMIQSEIQELKVKNHSLGVILKEKAKPYYEGRMNICFTSMDRSRIVVREKFFS